MLRRWLVLISFLLLVGAGCGGGGNINTLTTQTQGQHIAIVSLTIDDYAAAMHGWEEMRTTPYMANSAAEMLQFVEGQLATRWHLIPAGSFVDQPGYQQLAGPQQPVVVPSIQGTLMPLLADDRGQMVRGQLTPQRAAALSQVTGANLLAMVYSEWSVATGSYSRTSKAVAKTVLTIHDAAGNRVFYGRRDIMDDNVLGGWGHVGFNEESVRNWMDAYATGISQLVAGN